MTSIKIDEQWIERLKERYALQDEYCTCQFYKLDDEHECPSWIFNTETKEKVRQCPPCKCCPFCTQLCMKDMITIGL